MYKKVKIKIIHILKLLLKEEVNAMEKVLCPKCGEIIFEEPECEANGIITCDNCNNKIRWMCDGKKTITKLDT